MTERLVLDLVDKNLVTDQMVLTVGYDVENIKNLALRQSYQGEITTDRYGRTIPKHAHGTANLGRQTSSIRLITEAVMELCDNILDPNLLVRRINVTANHVADENGVIEKHTPEQLDLFTDYAIEDQKRIEEEAALIRERKAQKAMLAIQKKYGKNAILKGIDLQGSYCDRTEYTDRGPQSIMGTYDDITHLPHPTSPTHPRMSISARAAQFSPYATLTGYGDAVKETAR